MANNSKYSHICKFEVEVLNIVVLVVLLNFEYYSGKKFAKFADFINS